MADIGALYQPRAHFYEDGGQGFSPDLIARYTYDLLPDIPFYLLLELRRRIPRNANRNRAVAMWAVGVAALAALYPARSPLERRRQRERIEWP